MKKLVVSLVSVLASFSIVFGSSTQVVLAAPDEYGNDYGEYSYRSLVSKDVLSTAIVIPEKFNLKNYVWGIGTFKVTKGTSKYKLESDIYDSLSNDPWQVGGIDIDLSKVNLKKVGTYKVTYTITGLKNKKAIAKVTSKVKVVSSKGRYKLTRKSYDYLYDYGLLYPCTKAGSAAYRDFSVVMIWNDYCIRSSTIKMYEKKWVNIK